MNDKLQAIIEELELVNGRDDISIVAMTEQIKEMKKAIAERTKKINTLKAMMEV